MSFFRYTIEYKENTHAVSMSGGYDVRTSGLILSLNRVRFKDGDAYHIDLHPITIRNRMASCLVELPHSVEELDEIIDVLTKFKDCISNGKDPEELEKVFSEEKEN